MRALANYIMPGPTQALLVTAAFALISLIPILGVVSVLSGAAVALVTLRHGARQGLQVLVGASLITSLFMYFMMGTMALGLLFVLFLWLPLWALALLLRRTVSWSITLDAAVALGVLAVVVVYIATGDPVQWWQQVLRVVFDTMAAQNAGVELDLLREQLPKVAEWMTGVLAGALVLGLIVSMMLARWWQSLLYNPGGFRQEFYGLRQSRIATMAVLAALVISLLKVGVVSKLAADLMVIAVVVYSVTGLALVHALVAATGKHRGWLVALYVALTFVPPHVMAALAGLGFADSWMDFRARLKKRAPKGPDDGRGDE
jgi:hypothetical protein